MKVWGSFFTIPLLLVAVFLGSVWAHWFVRAAEAGWAWGS